jgi:hypothetical protein
MIEELDLLLQSFIPFKVDRYMDVGVGEANRTRHQIKCNTRLDCDGSFAEVRDKGVRPFFYVDALNIGDFLKPKQFDLITALDFIEHQTKEKGFRMLDVLEGLCRGRLILFTPLGEYMVGNDSKDLQGHLSGWKPEEFVQLGYSCLVMPNFHPLLGIGAFYAIKDFVRPVEQVMGNYSAWNLKGYWISQ